MKPTILIACATLAAGAVLVLPSTMAAAAQLRYEAEVAPATCDGTIDSNHAGFSGTGFCNGRNAVGAAAQFTVNAPRPAPPRVAVRFANGTTTTRPADVIVNGATVQIARRSRAPAPGPPGPPTTLTCQRDRRQQHDPAQPDHRQRPAEHRLPRLHRRRAHRRRRTRSYVATNGNDGNPGTLAAPLRTIQRAVDLAQPGTTIPIRGGTYAPSTNIQMLKNGTSSQPHHDAQLQRRAGRSSTARTCRTPRRRSAAASRGPNAARCTSRATTGASIGLEIINGPYGIFGLDTNNGIYDRLITRDNYESGLHLQGASGNNQIINLDSYGNRDPRNNGESADGLAIKEGSGSGNVVRGARLWNNSDDGLDSWEFLSPVLVENSLAYGNGFNRWGIPNYTGDGNGFKLGGGDEDLPAAHTMRNSMAWDNAVGGFIDNANPGALRRRPLHRLGQRRHRLRLRRRRRHPDPEPRGGQRHQRVARLELQRQRQLLEHRRHLDARQHRPEHDHRPAQRRRLHPVVDLPAPSQRRRRGRALLGSRG